MMTLARFGPDFQAVALNGEQDHVKNSRKEVMKTSNVLCGIYSNPHICQLILTDPSLPYPARQTPHSIYPLPYLTLPYPTLPYPYR